MIDEDKLIRLIGMTIGISIVTLPIVILLIGLWWLNMKRRKYWEILVLSLPVSFYFAYKPNIDNEAWIVESTALLLWTASVSFLILWLIFKIPSKKRKSK